MGQVLHGSATTTEAVRRAIQHSQESLRTLATRCGIDPKTVASGRSAPRSPTCRPDRKSRDRRCCPSKKRRSSSPSEPSILIPAAITELTGISTEMVAGQRIDAEEVGRFIDDAVLVIAHGAAFDRLFCEALFPGFADKHWACSNTEVDWQGRRHRGSKLTYLLNDIGLFYEGHRALDDCYALLEVLAATTPHATGTALGALLQTARKAAVRIWAQAAPFEHKDTLKARGRAEGVVEGCGGGGRGRRTRISAHRHLPQCRRRPADEALHESAAVFSPHLSSHAVERGLGRDLRSACVVALPPLD